MRALLVMVCILLASTLFIPTSTMARQLGEKDINDPPVFTTPNCGCGKPYKNCIPATTPPKIPPCSVYNRHGC
ncbi:hypothetical protein ES288_A01G075400v1 [Gossypium darwinii]|uniref:Uncharacterized protein n=2 Tax=Gossypium TaxID=3633 RepID=A0A5D2RQ91_GOSTO|nr:hypothetical protein ES288_A01G075400v1 [Gossypium darwinii]TYI42208.1 hypothetical protein ES332_A01G081900v1 [Gossypium tomentosum]